MRTMCAAILAAVAFLSAAAEACAVPENNDAIPYETVDMSRLTAEFETDWDGVSSRRCGSPTTARIRFLLDGRPQAVRGVRLRIDDWVNTIVTDTVDVATGGCSFAAATLREPGFLRFAASVGEKEFMRSVPYEPERLQKGSPTPADFMDYWRGEIARMEAEGSGEPTLTPVDGYGPAFDAWRVSFATVGGKRVFGILSRPYVDKTRFTYYGVSQGGYFAFVLAGLTPCFTRVVAVVPAGTDTMGYLAGRRSGWPRLVEGQSKANREAAEKWSPYFDAANFAPYVTAPIRVLCGCIDTTCPPTCVAAAYNALGSKDKDIVYMPNSGHGADSKCVALLQDWRRGGVTSGLGE